MENARKLGQEAGKNYTEPFLFFFQTITKFTVCFLYSLHILLAMICHALFVCSLLINVIADQPIKKAHEENLYLDFLRWPSTAMGIQICLPHM